jgi:hypothetical protein
VHCTFLPFIPLRSFNLSNAKTAFFGIHFSQLGCNWKCDCQPEDPIVSCKGKPKVEHECTELEYVRTQYPECWIDNDFPTQATCQGCPERFCSCDDTNVEQGCDWKCACKDPLSCPTEVEEHESCQDSDDIKVNYPKCWVSKLEPERRTCDSCQVKKCYCNAADMENNCHIHCAPKCP